MENPVEANDDSNSDDSFDQFLQSKVSKLDNIEKHDDDQLSRYVGMSREKSHIDPIKWWNDRVDLNDLKTIALGFMGIATSQSDVERSFSNLAFILSQLRCSLSDLAIKMILFIRINENLL